MHMNQFENTLTDREIVTDTCLQDLMADTDGSRKSSRLSATDEALLCNILEDICAELIRRRAVSYSDAQIAACSITARNLRDLATGKPEYAAERAQGSLTEQEHRLLSLCLPALCYELLQLRTDMALAKVA